MRLRQRAGKARTRLRRSRETTSQTILRWRLGREGHDVEGAVWVDPTSTFLTPVTLHRGSRVNAHVTFKGGGRVTIGAYCDVSVGTTVITSNHRTNTASMEYDLARTHGWTAPVGDQIPALIGAASWLGERCIVLPGANVGVGAICAAGSVVTRSVGPFDIVAGVPARVIGTRFSPEVVAFLVDLAWWDWDETRIARNAAFFEADLSHMSPDEIQRVVVD